MIAGITNVAASVTQSCTILKVQPALLTHTPIAQRSSGDSGFYIYDFRDVFYGPDRSPDSDSPRNMLQTSSLGCVFSVREMKLHDDLRIGDSRFPRPASPVHR
jgi:hypothetical protein